MRKLIDRLKRAFGVHIHEREVFCFGGLAVVKCMTCGAESIPWKAPPEAAKEWEQTHPDAAARYLGKQAQKGVQKDE